MRVWIDLADAPHVAFFVPIIRELERRGHQIVLSLRDFNQTVELARLNGLHGAVIGRHGGRSAAGKVLNLIGRSWRLFSFGRRSAIDVAVSHNSYPQTVSRPDWPAPGLSPLWIMRASRPTTSRFGVPTVSWFRWLFPSGTFEGSDARKGKWCAAMVSRSRYTSRISVPTGFPGAARPCLQARGRVGPGAKGAGHRSHRRPWLAYHPFTNHLFEKLLDTLNARPDLTVILLPRTPAQRDYYQGRYPLLRVPDGPLSGNDLVYFSDLVVSAGGTMNREAAVLGTRSLPSSPGSCPLLTGA